MRAIEFTEPRLIRLIDLPEPAQPGPGEALVRTHRMGICGTDLGVAHTIQAKPDGAPLAELEALTGGRCDQSHHPS